MGNRASYDQVPIGDLNSPSLNASDVEKKTERKVDPAVVDWGGSDLMFVFHDTEDDSEERVVHEQINNQRDLEEELKFTVTSNKKVISERRQYSEATDINSLYSILQQGDLVEFCSEFHCHHWVVYTGNKKCIRLKHCKVTEEVITNIHVDRMARIVNGVYRFTPQPSQQICSSAKSQIGKDSIWPGSECFAAWCRYGNPEFMSDQLQIKDLDSLEKNSNDTYDLEIFNKLNTASRTEHFSSLIDLIKYRRKLEKSGKT